MFVCMGKNGIHNSNKKNNKKGVLMSSDNCNIFCLTLIQNYHEGLGFTVARYIQSDCSKAVDRQPGRERCRVALFMPIQLVIDL